jgi:hypothetical protein
MPLPTALPFCPAMALVLRVLCCAAPYGTSQLHPVLKRAQYALQVADLQNTLRRKLLNGGSGSSGFGSMSQHRGVATAAASAAARRLEPHLAQPCIMCAPCLGSCSSSQLAQQRQQRLRFRQALLGPSSVTRQPRRRGVASVQTRPLATFRLPVT